MSDAKKCLLEYNSIFKENDDLYRKIARELGMSECTFQIFYMLREQEETVTQSEICSALYQPKQTVNSALKKLEQEGYLRLIKQDDRRSKRIELTEKGRELAERTVDRVLLVEQKALAELTEEEQKAFIGLFRKYTKLLGNKMQEIEGEK